MSNVATQPLVFGACLAAGVAAGVLYCLLGLLRRRVPHKWMDIVCDVVFVVLSGAMYFAALYFCDYGQIRLYTLVAFLGGFALLCGVVRSAKKHRLERNAADRPQRMGRKKRAKGS